MIFGFDFVRGSGNLETREYNVKGFHAVSLAGVGTLSIDQTGEESLRIEAEDNLFEHLRVEVRGDELYLGIQRGVSLRPTRPIKFILTVKDIEEITISGSGDVHTSALTSQRLKVGISGSGDIETGSLTVEKELALRISGSGRIDLPAIIAGGTEMAITGSGKGRVDSLKTGTAKLSITGAGDFRVRNVEAETVETRITGSGDVELNGKTKEQELSISSVGKYKAQDLESVNAKLKISGSGSAYVSVQERLDVRISGSGSVHYCGRPIVVQSISGAGKVKYIEN